MNTRKIVTDAGTAHVITLSPTQKRIMANGRDFGVMTKLRRGWSTPDGSGHGTIRAVVWRVLDKAR